MGNFDFIKFGCVRNTQITETENLSNFFNDEQKIVELKRLFNEAEMNTKIDMYSSAISLRWAWNFFLSSVDSSTRTIRQKYSFIFDTDNTIQIYLDQTRHLCNELGTIRTNFVDQYTEYIRYNNSDVLITDYIRVLGNTGAHATEGLDDENNPRENFLRDFFSDLSFEKVALGMEMSTYLLKRFFLETNRYRYSVDNIPLEGFEIVDSIKAETPNTDNSDDEYRELLPQRYIIGRHKYDDPRIDETVNSYSIIKEIKIPDDKIKDSDYNRKFKLMLERQLYLMSVIGRENPVQSISPYTGESHFTPYRFIGYSIPTLNLVPLYNNTNIYLQRIDELTGIVANEDFYIELAKIFADLEETNNVIIRGVTKENIWVYATEKGYERIYHPVFIGYDFCTFRGENITNQQTIDPITHLQISQNRYKEIQSLMPVDISNSIFLSSFFVIVFDLYCQSFNINYDNIPSNAAVRESMKERFINSSQSQETCVYRYINEIFRRIDEAINEHQNTINNVNQNPRIRLNDLSNAKEIYDYLTQNISSQNNNINLNPYLLPDEERYAPDQTGAVLGGDISEFDYSETEEYEATEPISEVSSDEDCQESMETSDRSTTKRKKLFGLF